MASRTRRYWVMKSEPDAYSFDDLVADPDRYEHWDGVRNFLQRQQVGDLVLYYHSNTDVPGVVGIAEVVREAYPDHTAFDPDDAHFDPKSDPAKPTWFMTDITAVRPLERIVSLRELQQVRELGGMALVKKGNRLSVMEITREQYDVVVKLAKRKGPAA